MKVVCSYCEKFIREKPPLDDPTPTHAICADCFEHYAAQWDGQSMGEFLDRFDSPVVAVDDDVRVLALNHSMAKAHNIHDRSELNVMGGELLECEHARRPEGCGRTVHCKACAIRNVVGHTIDAGKAQIAVPATQSDGQGLLLYTHPHDGVVLLLIEKTPKPAGPSD